MSGLANHEIVRRPMDTEKGRVLQETQNTYMFEVHRSANKIQVKGAIERLFGVRVKTVRTLVMRGKYKRRGMKFGRRPNWKKAFVTLQEGESISVFEGV